MPVSGSQSVQFSITEQGLATRDGAVLPAYCLRCGKRSNREPELRKYYGVPPKTMWVHFIKLGFRGLAIRLFGHRAKVGSYLCDEHHRSLHALRLIGLLMMLTSPVVFFVLGAALGGENAGTVLFASVIWFFAGQIMRAIGKARLHPLSVTKTGEAVFAKPNAKFLAAIGQLQQPRAAAPASVRPLPSEG